MSEALTGVLTQLAAADLAPDADGEFLSNLRALIATKVREASAGDLASQADKMAPSPPEGIAGGVDMMGNLLGAQSSSAPGGTVPGGAMPSGPMPGGMMPPPGVMGAGAPGPGRGVSPRPQIPDVDGLRRTLNIG